MLLDPLLSDFRVESGTSYETDSFTDLYSDSTSGALYDDLLAEQNIHTHEKGPSKDQTRRCAPTAAATGNRSLEQLQRGFLMRSDQTQR